MPIIKKTLSENPANRVAVIKSLNADFAMLDPGRKYIVEVVEETRSIQQNSYLWAVVYSSIANYMRDQKQVNYSTEAIHETLKEMFLVPRIEQLSKREVKIYKSTTKLTKREFSDYLEQIFAWAAEFGLTIPSPDWDYRVQS